MSKTEIDKMSWHIMPQDRGQLITVSYASGEGGYFKRITDASAPPGEDERVYFLAFEDAEGGFEPWNCEVPTGRWTEVRS